MVPWINLLSAHSVTVRIRTSFSRTPCKPFPWIWNVSTSWFWTPAIWIENSYNNFLWGSSTLLTPGIICLFFAIVCKKIVWFSGGVSRDWSSRTRTDPKGQGLAHKDKDWPTKTRTDPRGQRQGLDRQGLAKKNWSFPTSKSCLDCILWNCFTCRWYFGWCYIT